MAYQDTTPLYGLGGEYPHFGSLVFCPDRTASLLRDAEEA